MLGFWELAFPVLDDLMGCGMVHPFGPGWLLTTILRPLKLPEIMHDDHELLQVCGGGCKDAASEWMFDARMRVAVEQMVTMVQAHLETQLASVY